MPRNAAFRRPFARALALAFAWIMLLAQVPAGTAAPLPATSVAITDCSPNPFNPTTSIRFTLYRCGQDPGPRSVRLDIYDLRGRRVATVAELSLEPGEHRLCWHGRDDRDRPVRAGLYLARIDDGGGPALARLSLVR